MYSIELVCKFLLLTFIAAQLEFVSTMAAENSKPSESEYGVVSIIALIMAVSKASEDLQTPSTVILAVAFIDEVALGKDESDNDGLFETVGNMEILGILLGTSETTGVGICDGACVTLEQNLHEDMHADPISLAIPISTSPSKQYLFLLPSVRSQLHFRVNPFFALKLKSL